MTAAAEPTKKSLLERGAGLGEITRRELPMVAFTCGSEVTGMGAREGCGADFGETGESGTDSGSICGSGPCDEARLGADSVAEDWTTSIRESGESGASGGRT